ncbi:hypothetical protein ACIPW9_36215 [Streptomyces sp. NPDC090052]|uniref:hypothetical protein n=1 Tax=Streptomyces sp. NPDC090052 TaxID=3365931 RepID=UPI00380A6419
MSGETAAIGVGFLVGGPIGAIVGGVAAPAVAAAVMWRNRRREHDENANENGTSTPNSGRDPHGNGRGNGNRNGGGTGRNNNPGGGQHRTPKGHGNGADKAGNQRKPKVKDPVADKLSKLGKDLANKLKHRDKNDKTPKNGKRDGANGKGGADPKGKSGKDPKTPKDGGAKGLKDGLKDGSKGLLKDRGKQPASERPWRGRGGKDEKPSKDKKDRNKKGADDSTSSTTARDGLAPKGPKGGGNPELEQVLDGELIDDYSPGPRERGINEDDIVDAEIVDDGLDAKAKKEADRIALVRTQREKARRRQALAAGRKAAEKAARDGNAGDPRKVKLEVIRRANHRINLQLHKEDQLRALAAAAEKPRSTPVNYPAIQAAPAGTRTPGAAIARQIDFRGTTSYAILRAMAEQLAYGLHSDDDADMADHIVELTGIPNMCRNLGTAVQEAAQALGRTAPLHPSVIKHLNNAAVAARTASLMAENIMVVFVQAHRQDIIRVLDPRIGEERWNIRNAPGTLDAAKLRAAISSAHSARLALPGGSAPASGGGHGGSKLVPASDGSTRKLIDLMKNFKRGHMVTVLSEVAGSSAGVDAVADSIGKLYRRMQKTWPTENIVDGTVARTAGQVRRVSNELKLAVKAAQKAHERELRLNAKGRAGKGAHAERKWDVVGRRGSSE